MPATAELRDRLLELLGRGNAHMAFDDAVKDFPMDRINDMAPNVPYSPWYLLEHMRLTQQDILEYIEQEDYRARAWPDGSWPPPGSIADEKAWHETIRQFHQSLTALEKIVADESRDLEATVPSNDQHTILREIVTVASHNHYHIGEFAILRQVMGTWPLDHR